MKDIITKCLFRYNRKNKNEDNIIWLKFNNLENILINQYKSNSIIDKQNYNLFQKKICNCLLLNNDNNILLEKNEKEIKNIVNNSKCHQTKFIKSTIDIKNKYCCICNETNTSIFMYNQMWALFLLCYAKK